MNARRNRKIFLATAGGVALVVAMAGCLRSPGGSSGTSADEVVPMTIDAENAAALANPDATSPQPVDADEDAFDAADDSDDVPDPVIPEPQGDGGGGGADPDDEDVPLEPVDDDQPAAGPCDSLPADGSSLLVGPDPLVLDDSTYEGVVTILNCSDGDIDWTAATKPSITLASAGANVLPGEAVELGFTIDKDAWDPGAIEFKIKVSEPGHNHYVDVHGYRPLTGADLTDGIGGLSAGEGAGGCANQCIVSALLRRNLTSPNLSLDITTDTPAKIRTYVSTQEPVDGEDGPEFPGVEPMDVSAAGATSHTASLAPLAAATKYHIIVTATDENDHTSYRAGSFTTITPVDGPGGFQAPDGPAGCAADCITKALITAGADHTSKHLSMASHTPAQFQVSASTEAPNYDDDGVPSFEDSDFWQPSGLEYISNWETDLVDLQPGTSYHVIVQAVDADGNIDRRAGQFHTPDAPTFGVGFSVLGIHVDQDGDHGSNRGELRFGWRVGDVQAGYRGEAKVSTGDWVNFSGWQSSFAVSDVTEWLPTVYVSATERDADGLVEFCTAGLGTSTDHGHSSSCDVVWSVASSGLVTLDGIPGLPRCADLGFEVLDPELRCMTLTTGGEAPGGYPEITATVAVSVAG